MGGVGGGGWYRQGLRAGGTAFGSGLACSGPCTGRSPVQGCRQPPYAPPFLGHTVLTGLGPPIFAGGGPRSYTGLSNSQGPCGYHSLVSADLGLMGALCFLYKISLLARVLGPRFHSHFHQCCLGNQGKLAGCNSPWVLLQFLVLLQEACSWGSPVNELHSLTWCALGLGLDLDVDQDLGAGAVGGDDAGVAGRSPGGIIHGAPAGSRVGCCGNHRCAHGRTASLSPSVAKAGKGEVR